MMFDNLVPYTDLHELNLDWIIKKVKENLINFEELENFVNESTEKQNEIIKNAVEKLGNGFQELEEYIKNNLEIITNTIINELIESGILQVGLQYNEETEELTIVLTGGM